MKLYVIAKVTINGIHNIVEIRRDLFKSLKEAEDYLKEKDIIKINEKFELYHFGYDHFYDVYEKKNNKNLETFYVIEELKA